MNRRKQIFNDHFLKQVAIRANSILNYAPEGSSEELSNMYSFSEKYLIWKNGAIQKAQKPKHITKTTKRILLIAAIITALIVGAMSVSAIREYIYELFLTLRSDHAVISYSNTSNSDHVIDNQANTIDTFYTPQYIPEDYELIYEENTPLCHHLMYMSGTGLIEFQQYTIDTVSLVDTERHEIHTIEFNNATASYFYSDNFTCFVWTAYNYKFCITADLSLNEIMNIAQSVGE